MGMAASQARYLSLCARMNDIEYQGQQINQQRTTLSNQTNNYYNSLLELSVPTPPSTKDFTKIEYSGVYGVTKFTLGNVTPSKVKNKYDIELKISKAGASWEQAMTADVTKHSYNTIPVGNYSQIDINNLVGYYIRDQYGVLKQATPDDFIVDEEGTITGLKNESATLVQSVEDGGEPEHTVSLGEERNQVILSSAKDLLSTLTETEQAKYIEGLRNTFPQVSAKNPDNDAFLDYFEGWKVSDSNGQLTINLLEKELVTGENNSVPIYQFSAAGIYETSVLEEDCLINFDSSGRIESISVPTEKGATTYANVKVSVSETTDELAYEDAFNQYEYEKYVYDKKQNEINAKISIVQQEDKNLELKLTRLDNERNAVKTELEAVKKVVDDNIEKSFKTFSG